MRARSAGCGAAAFLLALAAALASGRAAPAELTPEQTRLVELLSYIHVVQASCGYRISLDVLRLAARQEGLTFSSPLEMKIAENALLDARMKFAGIKRSVECAYALEEYGPTGSTFKGLVARPAER
jgi:hypothetical protein